MIKIFVQVGEKDQAFQWLDKAYEQRTKQLFFVIVDPLYDAVRADPRFAALLKKLKLD
jgi:hypothetical protein